MSFRFLEPLWGEGGNGSLIELLIQVAHSILTLEQVALIDMLSADYLRVRFTKVFNTIVYLSPIGTLS